MLLSASDLDRSFSTDGRVSSALNGGYNNAHAVAVQSDGKVIVVGQAKLSTTRSTYGFAAIRYNADGTLDDGGSNDSTPGDQFGAGGKFLFGQGTDANATSIAIQRDGKIILAGTATSGGSVVQQYWVLVRLNTDGSLDKTFGQNGIGGEEFSIDNTPLNAIALQSDGKIVAAGSENGNFLVGRFTAGGELDDTFADFGTATADFGGTDSASAVAIDNVGNIVVVGGAGGNGVNQKIGVARYQSDGTPDPNFATNGQGVYQSIQRTDVVGAVITGDGIIRVAESIYTPSGSSGYWDATIEQVNNDGSGGNSEGYQGHKYTAITLMPDGEYALSGINLGSSGTGKFFVEMNGAGEATTYAGFANATATSIAAGPDGTVVVAGSGDVTGGVDFVVVKYLGVNRKSWGAISGNIFRDLDRDGVKDRNEPGTPNVRVFIDFNNDSQWEPFVQGFPNEPSVLTDSVGNYTFKNVTQITAKIVRELVPGSTVQETPASGSYSVTPVLGKTVGNINFVNSAIPSVSRQTAIVGSVFNDYSGDAKRQTTGNIEPDMTGAVVYLDTNKNGKLDKGEASTKTDVSGNYTLVLPKAGTYRVAVVPPTGYTNTTVRYSNLTVHSHTQGSARFGVAYYDTDDTIAEVSKLAAVSASAALNGTLASASDVNMYRFTVKAGQSISFDLDLARGSSLDSYLRLFDSSGTQLAANDNGIASGESASLDSYIKYRFAKAGTYYIAVSDHLNKTYGPLTGTGDTGSGTLGKYALNLHASG